VGLDFLAPSLQQHDGSPLEQSTCEISRSQSLHDQGQHAWEFICELLAVDLMLLYPPRALNHCRCLCLCRPLCL
jgi:hypothetical protein